VSPGTNVERGVHRGRPAGEKTETPAPTPLFAEVRHESVRAAAGRVLDAWTNDLGEAIDPAESREAMTSVAVAVDQAAGGLKPEPGGPAQTVLGRHLLTLLRADLLRHWPESATSTDSNEELRVLRAIEAVREAVEPDWSQYFNSRLAGPDGLDLVVEVAHDLRSPVTSILFLAETLGRGQSGEVSELQKRQLRLIYSAALGLSSMASDVIELARGGDQLAEKELSPFSVSEVIESVADMVRPIAEEKGLELRYNHLASDHRQGRPLVVSRVLLNLTTNALKFTDDGYVEITTRAKGMTRVEFSVRDTGHGITEEAAANMFQPFRRTRARSGRSGYYFSGTGLGLAMCRKLLEASGAELKFETKEGWGTRFHFELDLPQAMHL